MAELPLTNRRQRRLETIEGDIRSALQEVGVLKASTASANELADSLLWAESRLDYARAALKSLKGDFAA